MPDAALPDDSVLTEAFWTPNVRQQVVTQCTSITRPAHVAGRLISETDTGLVMRSDGAHWVPVTIGMACLLTKSVGQTVTTATDTDVTWDVEEFDVGGLHSTVSNTDRITIPAGGDGLWLFQAQIAFPANAAGIRGARLTPSTGVHVYMGTATVAGSSTYAPQLHVQRLWRMTAGQHMRVIAYQNSGGDLDVEGNNGISWFSAVRLGG